MITGVNHITLAVRDIGESFAFYTEILGFHPLAKWGKGAYLLAGNMWVALIPDRNLRETTPPEYTQIAFSVSPRDFKPVSYTHLTLPTN